MARVDVVVVGCGAPRRSMGWYHCTQLLDGRLPGARLTDAVEPWLLGEGRGSEAARELAAWAGAGTGVRLHASVRELPQPVGPTLALVCGRTAENPRLFRQLVDQGFSHVYLEKPGATTAAELEEMAVHARSRGVAVFMGYNRNFSKYVRRAHEFFVTAPDATLTLARLDCFDTPESLDECFERNAEGMMKNMMCHELMVLITYYGLTVDMIADVVPDRAYTHSENRRGFTDFLRVGFTLRTKSGRELIIRGDRSGGEYAEAVVSAGGTEVYKAVRPDPEIIAAAAELEKVQPGCMPYFYLQDGEYLALKKQVIDHIAQGASGRPEGVASIDDAIEGLKMCDHITKSLALAA